MGRQLEEMIRSQVQELRRLLFDSEDPPFREEKAAAQWLIHEANIFRPEVALGNQQYLFPAGMSTKTKREIMMAKGSWPGLELGYSYFENDENGHESWVSGKVSIPESSLLLKHIAIKIKELARNTTWSEEEMLMHILTGASYWLNSIRIDFPTSPFIDIATVTLNNIRDISFEEFKRGYSSIKKHFGANRKRRRKDIDVELCYFAEKRAPGVWEKGIIEGYKELQKEWKLQHPGVWENDTSGYESMRKALGRAARRLRFEHVLPNKQTSQ